MRTVEVNFNRRNGDNNICLGRAIKTIGGARIRPGDRVRVTGDDLQVVADIVEQGGVLVAVPCWDTLAWVN